MAYTLVLADGTNIDLGKTTNENPRLEGNLTPLSLPGFGSSEAQIFEFGGALLFIDLKGRLIESTQEALATKVQALLVTNNGIVTGDQQNVSSYHSDLLGDLKVKILEASGNYESDQSPLVFEYTIKLIHSSIYI